MRLQHIRFSIEQGIARLTLACPEKRNVLSRQLLAEIRDALYRVENEQVALLILAAEGAAFSSGGDLSDPMTRAGQLADLLKDHYHPILRRLTSLSCPTVCLVDGMVVGGACGFILACDMVIATEKAQFVFPFGQIGLVPDCGLSWLLPRIVGPIHAKRLLIFGETLDSAGAFQIGMVSHQVEAANLAAHVAALIDRVTDLDRDALVAAKRNAILAETGSFAQALATECAVQHRAGQSARFKASLAG